MTCYDMYVDYTKYSIGMTLLKVVSALENLYKITYSIDIVDDTLINMYWFKIANSNLEARLDMGKFDDCIMLTIKHDTNVVTCLQIYSEYIKLHASDAVYNYSQRGVANLLCESISNNIRYEIDQNTIEVLLKTIIKLVIMLNSCDEFHMLYAASKVSYCKYFSYVHGFLVCRKHPGKKKTTRELPKMSNFIGFRGGVSISVLNIYKGLSDHVKLPNSNLNKKERDEMLAKHLQDKLIARTERKERMQKKRREKLREKMQSEMVVTNELVIKAISQIVGEPPLKKQRLNAVIEDPFCGSDMTMPVDIIGMTT